MVTLCWAAKGGSGTTVVTSTLALESPRPSLLVDLAGDIPLVLGLPEPDRPGVIDWLSTDGPASQLIDLVVEVNDTTALLPRRLAIGNADGDRPTRGAAGDITPDRWPQFVEWMEQWEQRHGGDVWIDAGTGHPSASIADLVPNRWLVTRACYLALMRAIASPIQPTGLVLVDEPGRSLRADDVERSLGVALVAEISYDPKVARAVDAGLLSMRPPTIMRRRLRRVAA